VTATAIPADVLAALTEQSPCIESAAIKPSDRIVEELGLDSLDLVEIVMTIEEARGIEISDAVLERIVTVADLVAAAAGEDLVRGRA